MVSGNASDMLANFSMPKCQIDHEEPWNQLEIDLNRLQQNYRFLRAKIPHEAPLYIVLKSDAYGHGLVEVGKALHRAGCRQFAVESPQEGILLRTNDIRNEILLLNPVPLWMAGTAVHHDLTVSVIHPSILDPLNDSARLSGKTCRIHLNVNVGLHRMGIPPSRLIKLAREVKEKEHIAFTGMFAQPRDHETAPNSYERLMELHHLLEEKGLAPPSVHFANSTTFLSHPKIARCGARLGILVYGVLPPEEHSRLRRTFPLKPVMEVTTEVVQLRELPKGSSIGYRAREKIQRDSVIATLPMGYAHGLDRKLQKKGHVLIHGKPASFIGAISMNSSTIDVTDIKSVKIGDSITIIGRQGKRKITVNDLAGLSNTISAELMVRLGNGIARRYRTCEARTLKKKVSVKKKGLGGIRILRIQSEEDMPSWCDAGRLTRFLQLNLAPGEDPYEVMYESISYALSLDPRGEGFLVLALSRSKVLGMAVCVKSFSPGDTPECTLSYLCVRKDQRGKGIGRILVKEAAGGAEGDLRMVLSAIDPGIPFLRTMGFRKHSIEMRLEKERAEWITSKHCTNGTGPSGTDAHRPMRNRS